jgi:AraC-like DNA-binding protein
MARLFPQPIEYGARDLALLLPKRHLERVIVGRPNDIPDFFDQVFPSAVGSARWRTEAHILVASLLRDDKLRNPGATAYLETIAARLGWSAATVRRRLRAEGTGFREIRDTVFDELAKTWLREGRLSIDEIAEKLGFSDVFAFRRSFKRWNGCSPSRYRRDFPSDPSVAFGPSFGSQTG